MAGLMQEVKKGGLLSNYPRMYSVLRDAAKALTVDQGLSLSDMVSLAENLRSLNSRSVRFITVPNGQDPTNAEPRGVAAARRRTICSTRSSTTPRYPRSKKNATPPATTVDTVSPSKVQVEVLNGNGIQGAAGQAASDLTSKGFHVVGTTNATNSAYTDSIIEYSAATEWPMANTLKAQLNSVQVQQVPGLAPGTIDLIIGSRFHRAHRFPGGERFPLAGFVDVARIGLGVKLSRAPEQVVYGGINGGTNICNDSGAFTGPDNPSNGT